MKTTIEYKGDPRAEAEVNEDGVNIEYRDHGDLDVESIKGPCSFAEYAESEQEKDSRTEDYEGFSFEDSQEWLESVVRGYAELCVESAGL